MRRGSQATGVQQAAMVGQLMAEEVVFGLARFREGRLLGERALFRGRVGFVRIRISQACLIVKILAKQPQPPKAQTLCTLTAAL